MLALHSLEEISRLKDYKWMTYTLLSTIVTIIVLSFIDANYIYPELHKQYGEQGVFNSSLNLYLDLSLDEIVWYQLLEPIFFIGWSILFLPCIGFLAPYSAMIIILEVQR